MLLSVNGCPICRNTEYFLCNVSSSSGSACLFSHGVRRSVDLCVCTECGCVYVDDKYLEMYKEIKNKE